MKKEFTDQELNQSVGNLLRFGVLSAVVVSILGFCKLIVEGFSIPDNYESLSLPSENIWKTFWTSLLHLEAVGIIQLGVLILILTPLLRIVFALIGYFKEKDYTYVIISFLVLAIMFISFISGYTH